MKKVGITGSGNVGRALAKGFIEYGFETTIASRSDEKRKELEITFDVRIKTDTPENTARDNEPLAMLWCIPGFKDNSWNHAFKLLKK